MVIRDEELDRLIGKGPDFEKMIHGLIRAEAWACGIRPNQIDWDYRTNVPDGGIDVLIRVGNRRADRQFLPSVRSVWSLKSGLDGVSPATLRKELNNHPEVIGHLKTGGAYVWCAVAPASQVKRENLRRAVDSLAKRHKFSAHLVHFLFRDTITQWLNQHVGLIPVYFPRLPHGWKSLREWRRLDRNYKVPWVKFGDRAQLVIEIRRHLLTTSDNNVIHLAGWSGIGKTRTVLRACQHRMLEGVLCFPTLGAFTSDFEDYLTRNEWMRAVIVIDEVEIDEFVALQTRLSKFRDRVRIVTIGAGTSKSVMFRRGVISVSLPDSTADVTQVIRAGDSSLSAEQAQKIADWCDHDLRLALLLADANKLDPGLANQPITSVDDVWKRLMKLFESEIGDVGNFRDLYEVLSICVDVGNLNEKRAELEYLAAYFGKLPAELDRAIAQACNVGVGRQQGRFFEAAPRALARRVFEKSGWDRIKNNALQFISGLPTERFQRRFIERIQECDQSTRGEAAPILNDWRRHRFPEPDLTSIYGREASRVFAEYAETEPFHGLRWLRQAVDQASPNQLLAFDSEWESDGWRGRRQIVWLCQHLAQFQEHVWDCEAILFRLAQYETEANVGNNSLKIWQSLFLPFFSNTPLPFDIRWQHLMKRLSQATDQQLPLIITAAVKALNQSVSDLITGMSVPKMVGGRPAPPMWRPGPDGELYKLASASSAQFIEMVKGMPPDHQRLSKAAIIDDISTFIQLGSLDILREWLAPQNLTEDELRRLRLSLDHYLDWLTRQANDEPSLGIIRQDHEKQLARRALEYVSPWRRALDPQSITDRIREITGRSSWEQMTDGLIDTLDAGDLYQKLAAEILAVPEEMDKLWDWFNGEDVRSDFELGRALGDLDISGAFEGGMLAQLADGKSINLVAGYFYGQSLRLGGTPAPLAETLDAMADGHPDEAIFVTLRADISESGFERLMRLTPKAKPGAYSWLGNLRIGQAWPQLMSDERQVRAVILLAEVGQGGQPQAYDLAIQMVCQWTPVGAKFSDALADALIPILTNSLAQSRLSTGGWYWMQAVGRLPDSYASHKIDLLIEAVKETADNDLRLRSDALSRLGEILQAHPAKATPILEEKILTIDPDDQLLLGNLLGLFDAGQIESVQRLIGKLGIVGARALASHLRAPYPTAEDPLHVPPITAWLLEKFEEDDEVFDLFRTGFHRIHVCAGGFEHHFTGTEERVAPYLNHPLRRIREWAQDEIDYAKFMSEWDRQMKREQGRI